VKSDESKEFLIGRIQRLITLHEAINELTDHLHCPTALVGSALRHETTNHCLKEQKMKSCFRKLP
jgi:hypothetical protein